MELLEEIGGIDPFDTLGRVHELDGMEETMGGTLGTIVGGLG